MTTQRQRDDLRGAHVRPLITTATDHTTTLINGVFRGEFKRPDGTRVVLAAGPRCALLALLSYRRELEDPDYRLQMDKFVAAFKEKRDTVYRWIRVLEDEGFVYRWRANDPATGKFAWYIAVADSPRLGEAVTDVNPQVGPSLQKGGDGAAPPVDKFDNRRSDHPHKSPGWIKPSMDNPDTATPYRETKDKELPASSYVPDARAHEPEEEAAARPFATAGPPRLLRSVTSERTPDEEKLASTEEWTRFIQWLAGKPQCRWKLVLTPLALETLAIRAMVAHEQRGWSKDQLRDRLLGNLETVDNLAGVWAWRLHPNNLPDQPGQPLDPALARAGDPSPVPTAGRIAEIRELNGVRRGKRFTERMGGAG